MFIFSASLYFSMYFVNTTFNNPNIASQYTYTTVNSMSINFQNITHFTGGQNPNPLLYFGDFLIGVLALFNILAGVPVANMLYGLMVGTGFDATAMNLLVEIIYGTSQCCLWVYVVANRSI